MPEVNISLSSTIGGVRFSGRASREAATVIASEPTALTAGNAGTLSTRTDNDTGVITATSADHDIVDADVVDVYWGSGSTAGIRRGMTVGTVAGTSIPVDGGAGDNLPVADTAVVIDKQVTLNVDATAAEITAAMCSSSRRASVQFQQSNGTAIKSLDLGKYDGGGEAWDWYVYGQDSTPFGADVGKVVISNGSSAGTNTVAVGLLVDSDS